MRLKEEKTHFQAGRPGDGRHVRGGGRIVPCDQNGLQGHLKIRTKIGQGLKIWIGKKRFWKYESSKNHFLDIA